MANFTDRHIGPRNHEIERMLRALGYADLETLVDDTIPASIRSKRAMNLPSALDEDEMLREMRRIASQNQVFRSYLGLGYHGTIVPGVIQRNIFENPGWYTQYTPYQAEISQGRLEALLNFQTMICDLTGLSVANASLLDEGTAAAEAMAICYASSGRDSKKAFFVAEDCHPQTIAVVSTRAAALGVRVETGEVASFRPGPGYLGALVQNPGTYGDVRDLRDLARACSGSGVILTVAADPLSLVLLASPGEIGADIAIGSTQRFGVPMGFGGPHAAYLAVRDSFKRQIPGRLIGVSKDSAGKNAYRLSLQTREQHIRRDKATSNICTAQVLLAVMAGMYAVYHGPEGLQRIAQSVHDRTRRLKKVLEAIGLKVPTRSFFDTLVVSGEADLIERIHRCASERRTNLRRIDSRRLGVTLDETVSEEDLKGLCEVFSKAKGMSPSALSLEADAGEAVVPSGARRGLGFLSHPVFNSSHSETEMLRYIRRLEGRDLSLTSSMIPLGSCTMKLNASAEMFPVSWPEFSSLHPFAPQEQARGYRELFERLEKDLAEITGFDAVSLQPNAGSQGELAGLLVIRKYHESRGEGRRRVCLIPQSAHGTNPASAVMVGLEVVVVACDSSGNIDVADLAAKARERVVDLNSLMVTYPSTHGVFEERIGEICEIVHAAGGQVYMDGANLNAQVGYCSPGSIGADVCHLNLHKTFCIPHGGGGPGMGPIGVRRHLAPFLPGHPLAKVGGEKAIGAVSAAPWGSPSILTISSMYIGMMGADGLRRATAVAILNANYIASRLDPHYPVLYRGRKGRVAHECIVDLRAFKASAGIEVEDVAKRLMDYGFHAPTISFPVPGTMMIEPTESEGLGELDRFCDAMISIREEIREIEQGKADRKDNLLKNAPHTVEQVSSNEWARPYPRERAAYPLSWVHGRKFWPSVSRIDNVYGDRNLVCTCPGVEA